ncbi:DUF625-domain-containing protein, partial [Rhodotorula sp. JG-1b]
LPEPKLGSIPDFDNALRSMSRSAVGRERAASVVLRTGVIEKLCQLQKDAEDLESLEDLHALCRVMQQILLLNDNAIFEHILQDDVILGVVGVLEYDPEFPTMRASYRQHLSSPSAFVPVVPSHLLGAQLLGKIHQTHRLHYLKDIVLARIIEDSTFSMLNSAIYFNEVEIVNVINSQPDLLLEVFRILKKKPNEAQTSTRKLHAMLFLQQLAQMAKNLQLPPRTAFYKNMCERGLLSALESALRFAIDTIRSAALGVWIAVVDLDPADVRAFCLRQGKEQETRQEADTLLGLLLCMFKDEEDLGIKAQLTEALRVLVDVTGEGSIQPVRLPLFSRSVLDDPEAERFLQYFYDHCVLSLLQPLLELPEPKESDPPLNLSAANVAILTHLCDLLCFFVSNHTFRSKYLILSTPTLAKAIGRLLRPKPRLTRHTHLRLAALRFLRACVARADEFYNRFLVKHDLIRPVLETAAEERDKDNLLGSACLEFFEHVRTVSCLFVSLLCALDFSADPHRGFVHVRQTSGRY